MTSLELIALGIIALYLVARGRLAPDRGRFLARLGWLAAASFIGEESAIRAYGFYAYSPSWTLFVGQVPLVVVLIWPAVIHSAWDSSRHLLDSPGRIAIGGALLVGADASLIEPISVAAGLWHWTEPGLFGVPPIGILGWALHAGFCLAVLEHGARRATRAWTDGTMLLVAPVGMHALLCATWWAALRWVNVPLAPWPVVLCAWLLSAALTARALTSRARERIPPAEMWTRVPAALYFLGLLLRHGLGEPALVAYAVAFAPPYIALTRLPRWTRSASPRRRSAGGSTARPGGGTI